MAVGTNHWKLGLFVIIGVGLALAALVVLGARSWNDLPAQAVKYVRYIEELIGAPVALLSTSPEREDTILVTDPFQD